MHQEDNAWLRQLAGGPREAPRPGCPEPAEWASLAVGLEEGGRREELLAHASECDACGAALRTVMDDFSLDLTEAESKVLESLESSKPEWQRDMARKMADISRGQPSYIRPWLARAAAVLLAVGGGWVALESVDSERPGPSNRQGIHPATALRVSDSRRRICRAASGEARDRLLVSTAARTARSRSRGRRGTGEAPGRCEMAGVARARRDVGPAAGSRDRDASACPGAKARRSRPDGGSGHGVRASRGGLEP